ncbi:hypothetical protein SCANM63S_04266 [Streptomyces canarius]
MTGWFQRTGGGAACSSVSTVPTMGNGTKRQVRPAAWALQPTLWIYAVVSIPLYMWFLHHAAVRWAGHLEQDDSLRFWFPVVVPGAGFTFTLLAAISWWCSAFTGTDFRRHAGRSRWSCEQRPTAPCVLAAPQARKGADDQEGGDRDHGRRPERHLRRTAPRSSDSRRRSSTRSSPGSRSTSWKSAAPPPSRASAQRQRFAGSCRARARAVRRQNGQPLPADILGGKPRCQAAVGEANMAALCWQAPKGRGMTATGVDDGSTTRRRAMSRSPDWPYADRWPR